MGKFLFILVILLFIVYSIFKFVIYNRLFLFFLNKNNQTSVNKNLKIKKPKLTKGNFFKPIYNYLSTFSKKMVLVYLFNLKKFVYKVKKYKNKKPFSEYSFKNFESFTIISFDGVAIYGKYLKGKNNKLIIFSRDFNSSDVDNYLRLSHFIEKGYSVLYYYSRAEYLSEGDFYTYGFLEKYDLNKIVEWSKTKISGIKKILLYGSGTGAIVSALYVNEWSDIDCVLLENCLESYLDIIKNYFKKLRLPENFQDELLNNFLDYCNKYLEVDISQLSPIYAIMRQNIKVIFYATESKYKSSHQKMLELRNLKKMNTYSIETIKEVDKLL